MTTTLAASVTAALAACGSQLPPDPKAAGTAAAPVAHTSTALPPSKPTGMKIEAAGVDAKKMVDPEVDAATGELGAERRHGREPPRLVDGGRHAGREGRLRPGRALRHPGLMTDVEKIKLGDLIEDFPTGKVYADTQGLELRPLTCGGDIKDGHRTNNIIFYADLTT
ncbi:hypothetical protein [Streptomyces katrae]|uniref:hypothetical protein n=1 Tax=Streptomyces katrae TaxID=68223 RepID=UPI001F18FCE2|nr:hypothetical protein [Streptomyces katrae]